MKLGIVGSRDWPDKNFVMQKVADILALHQGIDTLVSGGQPKGVDGWVPEMAIAHGKTLIEYLPAHFFPSGHKKYEPYHPKNFFERNTLIAEASDILVAFCFEESKGTLDTVKKARKIGKSVIVYKEIDLGKVIDFEDMFFR